MASTAEKYGDPMQASFTTVPFQVFDVGHQAGENYLEVPLTGCVDSVLDCAEKSSVYIAGFRLEADVSHSARLRGFVQSVLTTATAGETAVAFNGKTMEGVFGGDRKGLMDVNNERLRNLIKPVYTRVGNDGTLFGADIKPGAPCRSIEVRKDGGTKKTGSCGRVEMELGRPPLGGSMTTCMEMEKLETYVPVKSLYTKGTDSRDVVLLGLRPKVAFEAATPGKDGGRVALLENVRVTLYLRQKMMA